MNRFIPLFVVKPRIGLFKTVRHTASVCQRDISERVRRLSVRTEIYPRKRESIRCTELGIPQYIAQIAVQCSHIISARTE